MAFNGSGTFNLIAGNPVVTGTTISSTWANNTLSDIATGLSTTITKNGQTTPTANIPMGGFKLTGLGAATTNGDALRYENLSTLATAANIQVQTFTAFTTAGTNTAYTLTTVPPAPSLVEDQRYQVEWHTTSGAAPTLARDGLTAKNIMVYNSAGAKVAPATGTLVAGVKNDLVYDGTDYVVLDPLPLVIDELVNAQTGTTYTYLTGDRGKLVTHTNGSAIAGTLPQAGTSFPSGWWMDVQNRGVGTLTITPTTSTIDGAASVVLVTGQGMRIASDGTNYFTQRGVGPVAATQAEMEAGSSTTAYVTPANIKWAPGVSKTWVCATQAAGAYTLAAALGISSLNKLGTGNVENNYSTSMSGTAYSTPACCDGGASIPLVTRATIRCTVTILRCSTEAAQDSGYSIAIFGDQ